MTASTSTSDFQRILENVKSKVNDLVEKIPPVDEQVTKLAKKLNTEKAYVILGVVAILLIGLLSLGSGDFAVDLVGFVYPVYASIKAIETQDNKEDDTFWLTYWLVFALFKVVENVADVLISSIPFYFLLKIGFLYWCFSSQFQGSKFVYKYVIKQYIVPQILPAAVEETKEKETKKTE